MFFLILFSIHISFTINPIILGNTTTRSENMSRQAFKESIKHALATTESKTVSDVVPLEMLDDIQLGQVIQNCEAKLATLDSFEQGRVYVRKLYALAIARGLTFKSVDKLAFLHGKYNMGQCIMTDAKDCKELLGDKVDVSKKPKATRLVVFMDHSMSMDSADGVQGRTLVAKVVDVLKKQQERGYLVQVVLFGDVNQETHPILTLQAYESLVLDHRRARDTFTGRYTEFNPAWAKVAKEGGECVAILISDGVFNGRYDIRNMEYNGGVLNVIFYAPKWAPANVTKTHAQAISLKIPDSAGYNGDLKADELDKLDQVIDQMSAATIVPQFQGRTRIGTVSIPSRCLLPSGMAEMLSFQDGPIAAKKEFACRLILLYDRLLSSARQDIERCFFGQLFAELMSLVPLLSRFTENAIGTIKQDDMEKETKEEKQRAKDVLPLVPGGPSPTPAEEQLKQLWAVLYKSVTAVRDYIGTQYQGLRDKYKQDAKKCAQIDLLFQKATTVSERAEILEKYSKTHGAPSTVAVFPTCTNPDAIAAMFHWLRTCTSEPPQLELAHTLVKLFQHVRIQPMQYKQEPVDGKSFVVNGDEKNEEQDYSIPLFKSAKTGQVDILPLLRLFPGYLRQQLAVHGKTVGPDFTFQPRAAKRIACLLLAAATETAENKMPTLYNKWLMGGLQQIHIDESLTTDTDDANISGYWMRILHMLGPELVPLDILLRNRERIRESIHKYFLLNNVPQFHTLDFETPTWPGVEPYIKTDDPLAYLVLCDGKTGQLMDAETKACFESGREFVTDEEVEEAWAKNVEQCGAYIRPTMWTGGRVTVWNSKAPSMSSILITQLEKMKRYSQRQIHAHVQTLMNLDLIQSIPIGQDPSLRVQAVLEKCAQAAKTHMTPVQIHLSRKDASLLLETELGMEVKEKFVVVQEAQSILDKFVVDLVNKYNEHRTKELARLPSLVGATPYLLLDETSVQDKDMDMDDKDKHEHKNVIEMPPPSYAVAMGTSLPTHSIGASFEVDPAIFD